MDKELFDKIHKLANEAKDVDIKVAVVLTALVIAMRLNYTPVLAEICMITTDDIIGPIKMMESDLKIN